ncbi:MAG TPA: hypothetical protein VIY47_06260, partial [Ignavibacteriaceae bacterium]
GINSECWDLLPIEINGQKSLLIAGNNAVYQLWDNGKLDVIVSCMPWVFHKTKADHNTIFIGLDDGLMMLIFRDNFWQVQNKVAGISEAIYKISEPKDDLLLLGTLENGIIKLQMERSKTLGSFRFTINKMNSNQNLPKGGAFSVSFGSNVVYATTNGIYTYDDKEKVFQENLQYKNALGAAQFVVHRLTEDQNHRLWMIAYQGDEYYIGYFKETDGVITWHDRIFAPIANEIFHTIYTGDQNKVWMGGPKGLYKINIRENYDPTIVDHKILIRKVFLNKDSLYYEGNEKTLNYGDESVTQQAILRIPYSSNSISFNYASQYQKYASLNLYSHKLQG